MHATRPLEPGSADLQDGGPWVRWTRDERHVYAFVADVPDGAGGQIVLKARPGLLDPDTAERLDGQPVKAESGPEGVHVTSGGLETPLPTAIRFAAR
ncbi:MAG: hypothetical protein JF598_21235 [Streptomyces sp.]|nr:hypothetical protein [Streptomyces sp.]